MKEKFITFLKRNKGNISLMLITMIVTLITAIISASVIIGGCLGVLSLLSIDYLSKAVGMQLGESNKPGILGIILGILLTL